MDYIINQRQVILNFSERFCKNEIEVLNSACFKDVWGKFLDHIYKVEKQDVLRIIEILPNPKKDYIILFKLLLEFELNEISKLSKHFKLILEHTDILYELIENFYDYWRRIERYGLVYSKSRMSGVENASFTVIMNQFTNVILSTYRTICHKVLGEAFSIYRSLPSGVNAGLMISKHNWMGKESKYAFLSKAAVLEQVLIRPPFITYSSKNKRTGTYPEAFTDPIPSISNHFKAEEFYCYAARVGSAAPRTFAFPDTRFQSFYGCLYAPRQSSHPSPNAMQGPFSPPPASWACKARTSPLPRRTDIPAGPPDLLPHTFSKSAVLSLQGSLCVSFFSPSFSLLYGSFFSFSSLAHSSGKCLTLRAASSFRVCPRNFLVSGSI